ncbi:MAG: DEAD/DEAH box helicase [Oceanospirillaceae bacterium]|nr:DEAD/DEAH box helicase [Oceanospirillaceae bacterium]
MTGFSDLGLRSELLETLRTLEYSEPTPVQQQAIPVALKGRDLVAEAQTGTGKTASFALPMIQRLSKSHEEGEYRPIRGLVLVPTRELSVQVADDTLEYGRALKMRVVSIYGGVRFDNQIRKLKRGADILVATPGRLLDLIRHEVISLAQVEMLVFDEADRMLDLGFIDDIRKLLDLIPEQRQTLLFSATLNESVEVLAEKLLTEPKRIAIAARNSASKQVKQSIYAVERGDKADVLAFLIKAGNWQQTLVFTRTKAGADALTESLQEEGISAAAIHGDRSQRDRLAALKQFTDREVRVLVATDVAARGLHIEALPQVVNFDLPNQPEAYVHRIGRTGRAGMKGHAISLVGGDERRFLKAISDLIGKPLQLQPVPTFENGKLMEGGYLSEKQRNPSKRARAANKKQKETKPKSKEYREDSSRPALRQSLFKK